MYGVEAATFGIGNKIKESEACLLCKEQGMNRKPEMTLNRLINSTTKISTMKEYVIELESTLYQTSSITFNYLIAI